jgi:hypothetical protein
MRGVLRTEGCPLTIDDVPLWLLFVATIFLVVAAVEFGFFVGRTARRGTEEKESPVSAITVAVEARIPTGLWVVLYALVALGMAAVGYQAAMK